MAPFSGAFWVLYFTVQVPAVVYTHNLIRLYIGTYIWFENGNKL